MPRPGLSETFIFFFFALLGAGQLVAQDEKDLAKQLANPVSSLVSVPFPGNFDHKVGPFDQGHRFSLNVQPVSLNEDWNLVSRTIFPIIRQDDVLPGTPRKTGTGDTVQSVFFSPAEPTEGGITWGLGPVFLVPTASEPQLGSEKWGAGPTGVVLKQSGPWTISALVNHIWSFAGDDNRDDMDSTFIQPFFAYTTLDAWTITVQAETTYDWESEQWNVPVGLLAAKVIPVGSQTYQIQAGPRYYADSPDAGAEGLGFRLNFILLFPKGGQ